MRRTLIAAALLAPLMPLAAWAPATAQAATAPSPEIAAAVADTRRKEGNRARDAYRHPAETLSFFGVKPDQTVVEIWPSGGWYMEILAPMLRENGHYIGATPASGRGRDATVALMQGDPKRFDKVHLTVLDPKAVSEIAPAGTADVVVTFRNVHNFLMAGDAAAAQVFADMYKALKPGGVLGVVDHRLPESADVARKKESGYIKKSTVVRLAEAAGFKLAAESEVNANPKDTTDWPKGVWTLPPGYAEGDATKAKYAAIGESDRFTLKFVKPE